MILTVVTISRPSMPHLISHHLLFSRAHHGISRAAMRHMSCKDKG